MLRTSRSEAGQILPIFALSIVALFAMAALLFDAAQALVVRRQLHDATDAAALAAANVIQSGIPRGCSAFAGPGAPRTTVVDAARASLTANVGATLAAAAVITCPTGWNNGAVRVTLSQTSPSFFARILGRTGFDVNVFSTAVNSYAPTTGFSVLTLNPHNPGWIPSRQGCPSFFFNGAPTVVSHGSIQVNSACAPPRGYALARNGQASTVTLMNGSVFQVTGRADPGALTIVPPPVEGVPPMEDPLRNLPPPNIASLPIRSLTQLTLNGQNNSRVLDPGRYIGGIRLQSSARAFLRPGIYVMEGGGFDIGAQAKVYTVRASRTSTTDYAAPIITNWAADCPNDGSCGVLIYNTTTAGVMGQYIVNAGAYFLVRGYQAIYSGPGANADYKGLLLWQARDPVPTNGYSQPTIIQSGGGSVNISGTIYAPSGPVVLTGTSGGGGGFEIDYFLQFIVWDLVFNGTSNWRLQYSDIYFAQPPDYGLVE